jgi:hypothetical protein
MRAIIDADRLPTAVRYYREYMSEPAPLLAPPITIDSGKFSPTNRLTLMSLLTAIDSAGEKEYLVVLHSNPDGLVLPVGIGQSSTITADKSVLTAIRLASLAFDLMDDTTNPDMAKNNALVNAWTDFFTSVPDKVQTSSISSATSVADKCSEASKLGQAWIDAKCKSLHMTETQLRTIASLADKVRRSDIDRLEFRSCRLGGGNGLDEAASFFGAWSAAPTVRTFYIHSPVNVIGNQRRLNQAARGLAPTSRRFTSTFSAAGPADNVAFAIEVHRLQHSQYNARLFSISAQTIFDWCSRFIARLPTALTVNGASVALPAGNNLARGFVFAGFWTPGTGKPFVFPREPEYPGFLESKA